MEEKGEDKILIGGDFYVRSGEEGEEQGGEDWVRKRNSKDRKLDREGRKLLEVIRKVGMQIFSGAVEGDVIGEFTYAGGRGSRVIDYVVAG